MVGGDFQKLQIIKTVNKRYVSLILNKNVHNKINFDSWRGVKTPRTCPGYVPEQVYGMLDNLHFGGKIITSVDIWRTTHKKNTFVVIKLICHVE